MAIIADSYVDVYIAIIRDRYRGDYAIFPVGHGGDYKALTDVTNGGVHIDIIQFSYGGDYVAIIKVRYGCLFIKIFLAR
jgi:hypothetical protein